MSCSDVCITDITLLNPNTNSLQITLSAGQTADLFKIDNSCWQTSNVFNNIELGDHIAYVKKNACTYTLHFKYYGLSTPSRNDSFTVSYSPEYNKWISFHDYVPNRLTNTFRELLSINNGKVYLHNAGDHGKFYGTTYNSYIDFVEAYDEMQTIENVNWISDVVDSNLIPIYNETINYVTVWNNYQTSGKILIDKATGINNSNRRNTGNISNRFYFNKIKDVAIKNQKFIEDIEYEFELLDRGINKNKQWKPDNIRGMYAVARLEIDNTNNYKVSLYDIDIETQEYYD